MTAFNLLTRADIAVRDDGTQVLVCDEPHRVAGGCAVTAQQIDAHQMPVGHAVPWVSDPSADVTVLRHGGLWLDSAPPVIPGLVADAESANERTVPAPNPCMPDPDAAYKAAREDDETRDR